MNINKYIKIIKKHISEINDVQAMELIEKTNYKNDTDKEIIEQLKHEIKQFKKGGK
ncbi:TPA: hypothetical protein ACXDAY_002128 [Clostridium botulinum]|uniref:hypothetical protein n=1 Tax=Clostridium botulinum TaxID=1491 RepID=UPI0004B0E735|nr:hypothetical protein [Clostridium botulinum]APH21019.1 hypothetical protein NPD1_4239 [Clostridium botulinum]APQ71129.1 hypothetical protein RSJ8_4196 [Clostridium botulinum]APR02552.1 hypothetical protein RSJ2_4059 [Clostridium botulinum]